MLDPVVCATVNQNKQIFQSNKEKIESLLAKIITQRKTIFMMMNKRNPLNLINKKIINREASLQMKYLKDFFISEQLKILSDVQDC